jgi:thiol-disulfide isomerase/thioredoxin
MFVRALTVAALAASAIALSVTGGPLAASLMGDRTASAPVGATMPKFDNATTWINSAPLSPEQLRGRVVLVEFWTYTCINWTRTMPYVRAWSEKYKDQGLVVIGVHAPEFSFEHDLANVRRAAKDLRVDFPIAVDNDFGVWRAFGNNAWPALYFIDAKGHVRHTQAGEGNYEGNERLIQQLLTEAGQKDVPRDLVTPVEHGAEVQADWSTLQSPETYLGAERTERFASPGGIRFDRPATYEIPSKLRDNAWALDGQWTMGGEATVLDKADGRVVYRFHARDVHLVMGSTLPAGTRFRVTIDGKPPGTSHGTDIDAAGNGVATSQRLYQLVRQPSVDGDRTVEITFLDPGAALYAFTFG